VIRTFKEDLVKKCQVNACIDRWDGKAALHVVTHAKWQRSRGRNPSEPYGEHRNPRKALSAALTELRTYQPLCGSHIPFAIGEMAELARFTKQDISGSFNGVDVTASPSSSVYDLVTFWRFKMNRRAEEYRDSPEGRAAAAQRAAQIAALQTRYAELMVELPTLDFVNQYVLLRWFHDFEKVNGDVDLHEDDGDMDRVVATFAEHGYQPDVNVGSAFNENDADNCARYIIGQCLSCIIKFGVIPQILPDFVDKWTKKFAPPPPEAILH